MMKRLFSTAALGLFLALGALSLVQAQSVPPPPSDPEQRAVWAKDEGTKLLADNAKRKGVKVLASGLQYEVLRAGPVSGPIPNADDKVRVNYQGTFIDGTEFDSSYSRGQPATFPIGKVIKGWQEALPMMHRGDIWRVWIPFDLAYGRAGKGPIGPQETLIFKIELLEINPTSP